MITVAKQLVCRECRTPSPTHRCADCNRLHVRLNAIHGWSEPKEYTRLKAPRVELHAARAEQGLPLFAEESP